MRLAPLLTLAIVATTSLSCEKESTSPEKLDLHKSCVLPPQPVRFVLLDKRGNAVVPTNASSLEISFSIAAARARVPYVLGTLQNTGTPGKYEGALIGCDIGGYSVRTTMPVKEFTLSWNGQPVGILTYDLQRVDWAQGCYREAAFLFNGKPVVVDETVQPFVALLPTEL